MNKGISLVPIFYLIMPIIFGLFISICHKKGKLNYFLYSILAAIPINLIFMILITVKTSSYNKLHLVLILFIWNTILTYMSSLIFFYIKRFIRNKQFS